jgi:flagellar motility protein MotE (MotC chaperone)
MYNNYGFNPYYQQRFQPMMQQTVEPIQNKAILNGKSVDSMDVVKAMDIPLDGSISYFPLTDGSAIVTKQLQMDGTSKTVVYKPIEEKKTTNYLTHDDLETIKKDYEDLKQEIKALEKKIKSKGE